MRKSKTRPTKSNIKSGGSKKKSPFLLGVVVLAGLLLLSLAGTAGYYKWRERDLKAQATNWRELSGVPGGRGKIYGCKQTINSPYGQLYKVKILVDRSTATAAVKRVDLTMWRDGRQQASWSSSAWWGNVTALEGYASVAHNDQFGVMVFSDVMGFGPARKYPAGLPDC